MIAIAVVAYIAGGILLLLWAVAIYVAVLVEQEEKLAPITGGSADMYSAESNDEEGR